MISFGRKGLHGLGEWPVLAKPSPEVSINGHKFVCMGKPTKGVGRNRRYLKKMEMDAIVCYPKGSSSAMVLSAA
jgi:hypothetical protein